MRRILVFRFSSMGDVALLVPVVASLVRTYDNVEVIVATRPAFAPFFMDLPRVRTFPADVDGKYSGFHGLRSLFRHLVAFSAYDAVIDAHDHLRTRILRTLFRLFGYKVIVFDKGRREKRAFVRKYNKVTNPLPHTVERYRAAFARAGCDFKIINPPYVEASEDTRMTLKSWLSSLTPPLLPSRNAGEQWIGLAPFAAHATKVWPLANYPPLIEGILRRKDARFFLFGNGAREITFFKELKERFPESCVIVAGQIHVQAELALMQEMDLLITVDSANMHLAVLTGTPLLSIWGGTDPDVGFGPFNRSRNSIVEITREELGCRPCSVYGKATCFRGDFACLTRITPEQILERIPN